MKTVRPLVSAMVVLAGASVAAADVRVIHASPDAPAVDVFVNGTPGVTPPAISGLAFTQATPYIPLPTAMYNFQVTPTGLPAPVVINVDAMIDGSTNYSVVAMNFLSAIQPVVFVDDNTINPGAARVRFIHAAPDVPGVDIFVAGGVDPIFNAVTFTNSGGYIEVPAGSYDLEVRLNDGGALALSVPGVGLEAGTVYTIWAMGALRDQNVQAVVTVDAIPAPGAAALLGLGGLLIARRRRA